MRLLPGSLRARLVAASVVATVAFSVGFGALASWRTDSLEDRALADALQARLTVVRDGVGPSGRLAPSGSGNPRAAYAQVIGADGRVLDASPSLRNAPALLSIAILAREGNQAATHLANVSDPDTELAVKATPVTVARGRVYVVVGVETQGFLSARREVVNLLLVGLACTILLVGLITWVLTGRALATVGRLTRQAERLSASNVARGLASPPRDKELAALTDALNRMLDRLNDHYARSLAAASETTHRLRTPLATLRAEAELAVAETDPERLRTALVAVVADADRISSIIDRFLASGRGATPEPIEPVARELRRSWRRHSQAENVRLEVAVTGAALVDPQLLRAVLDPIVENAIAHAVVGSTVRVALTAGDRLGVTVENDGPGVPADVLPRLFDAWVSGAGGRSGLGLWLARETAREAGGDVDCELPGPGLTRFRADLPATSTLDTREAEQTAVPDRWTTG